MITIERAEVMNLLGAVRGARNPLSSWDRMDSGYDDEGRVVLGENDLTLLRRLCHAGRDHRKFLRQVLVAVDLTAPLYWWKEFDTYKVGTVANSTSTMHTMHKKPITRADFSTDQMSEGTLAVMDEIIVQLEGLRQRYLQTGEKSDWYDMIQLLPSSYRQLRSVTLNYEVLYNMLESRRGHKLLEWRVFCDWAESLPYLKDLMEHGGAQ